MASEKASEKEKQEIMRMAKYIRHAWFGPSFEEALADDDYDYEDTSWYAAAEAVIAIGARCELIPTVPPLNAPAYCEVHQHRKWCGHNGGVMGQDGGWAAPAPRTKYPVGTQLRFLVTPKIKGVVVTNTKFAGDVCVQWETGVFSSYDEWFLDEHVEILLVGSGCDPKGISALVTFLKNS